MEDNQNKSSEGLVRSIGPLALGVNVFNMVVGAGIFILPGVIASYLGPSAILAFIICAFIVGLIFLCYAEVGSRVKRSGGSYAYIEEAFGPFAGSVASILFWFGWAGVADAAILVAMVKTITILVPELASPVLQTLFMFGLLAFLVIINIRGVKSGVRLYIINTIGKFIPLALLIVVGVFYIDIDNLKINEWPSMEQIGASTLTLFFIFAGAECALNASGEIKNPEKTVPRGIFLGLSSILLLYIGLQSVAQGVLGAELANNKEAPLAAAAEVFLGSWGGNLLLAGAIISIFATLSGEILATPRIIFATAKDGNLPKFLAKIHPKYNTPYVAIIFYAFAILAIALSGSFKELAVLASGSIMLIYAGVSLATLKIRFRDGPPSEGQFKMPGKTIIPLLSCSLIAWMLLQLTFEEAMGIFTLICVAVAIYFVQKVLKKQSSD